jgi:hypothetical protein
LRITAEEGRIKIENGECGRSVNIWKEKGIWRELRFFWMDVI